MKFIATKELGKLSKWLRILGYDTEYFTNNNIGSLIIAALKEERIILTRQQKMPQGKGVKVVQIASDFVKKQLQQVMADLGLKPSADLMFRRCILCNEELIEIEKERVKDKVPEYVLQSQEDFITCPRCKRIYWQGTHWGNVVKTLKEIAESG